MSGLSRRFAPHLVALCALALVAVVVHAWIGVDRDDCARPEAFLRPQPGAHADSPRQRFMSAAFEAVAWREGRISSDDVRTSLSWSIVRSFQPRKLYYQPETLLYAMRPIARGVEWLEEDGARLPVHRAWYRSDPATGATLVVAYLLIYRGEPVESGMRAQLRSAPALLVTGAAPMTLLVVGGIASGGEIAETEARARDWLRASWRAYRFACEE
jgi:hypothetical protein